MTAQAGSPSHKPRLRLLLQEPEVDRAATDDRRTTVRRRVSVPDVGEDEPRAAPAGRGPGRAVAVVIWRSPEGTRIARAAEGRVSAMSIQAIVIALDPRVDLESWLGDA